MNVEGASNIKMEEEGYDECGRGASTVEVRMRVWIRTMMMKAVLHEGTREKGSGSGKNVSIYIFIHACTTVSIYLSICLYCTQRRLDVGRPAEIGIF